MALYYTGESRDYDFVPSQGCSLEIFRLDALGNHQNAIILDIEEGFIRELFQNDDTTHTGSNGATLRTRTGADWSFATVLAFPAKIEGGLAVPFLQTLVGSSRSFAVKFNLGSAAFWKNLGLQGQERTYRANKAMLEEVTTRIDAKNKKVIGYNMSAVGNSLLWTWVGKNAMHPGVWIL